MSDTLRAATAEFIGTFAFFTIGAGTVVLAFDPGFQGAVGLLGIAAAHGIALAVMVTVFGGISGGHLNPAVTIGVWVGGKIETGRALWYLLAQLLAAVCTGVVLKYIFFTQEQWEPSNLGTPGLDPTVAPGRAILIEAILTFVLVITVWGTGVDPRGAKVGGFAIGLAVFADIMVGGPLTGAAMNPARHFGPALLSGSWANWWVYWAGPLIGGIVASLVYRGLFWSEEQVMPAVAAGATQPEDPGE